MNIFSTHEIGLGLVLFQIFFELIFKFLGGVLAGLIIGFAFFGQYYINSTVGKIIRGSPLKTRYVAYIFRVLAGIFTFITIIFVMKYVRFFTNNSLTNAFTILAGLFSVLIIGYRKVNRRSKRG